MAQRVLVWAAHPRAGSLSEGLAEAYAGGAHEAGAEVRLLKPSDMAFNSSGFAGYGDANAPLEPDLRAGRASAIGRARLRSGGPAGRGRPLRSR